MSNAAETAGMVVAGLLFVAAAVAIPAGLGYGIVMVFNFIFELGINPLYGAIAGVFLGIFSGGGGGSQ